MIKTYCNICGDRVGNITEYTFTINSGYFKQPMHLCETCTNRLHNIIRENPSMTLSGCLEELYDSYYMPDWDEKQ